MEFAKLRHKITSAQAFAVLSLFLTILATYFSLTGNTMTLNDSAIRIVTAGLVAFFIPGMSLLLNFSTNKRARHILPMSLIAQGVLLSSILVGVFALINFALEQPIHLSVYGILITNIILNVRILFWKKQTDLKIYFSKLDFILLLMSTFLGIVLYRWADSVEQAYAEVALHLQYIRQYASGLPLQFSFSVLRPDELIPSNHFFLWEFILASISNLAGVDIIYSSLRSRWIVPVAGFSAFFFFAEQVMRSPKKAQIVTLLVMVASIFQLFLLKPFPWDEYFQGDTYRGILSFMGSIHHSDTSMEILLPLSLGMLFQYFWRHNWRSLVLLMGALFVCFFWHPRELFQVMWIGVIAVLVDFIFIRKKQIIERLFKCYVPLAASFLVVVATVWGFMAFLNQGVNKEALGEIESKQVLFENMKVWLWPPSKWFQFDALFSFQSLGAPTKIFAELPVHMFAWFILVGCLSVFLVLSTRHRKTLWLFVFYVSLWVITNVHYLSQHFLVMITYSEILMSKIRFLFPFGHLLFALAFYELFQRLYSLIKKYIPHFAVVFILCLAVLLGFVFKWLWLELDTLGNSGQDLLVLFVLIAFVIAFLKLNMHNKIWVKHLQLKNQFQSLSKKQFVIPAIAMICFCLPATYKQSLQFFIDMKTVYDPGVLFKDNEVFRASAYAIRYAREFIPPRSMIQVQPRYYYMFGVFAPVYTRPLLGNVLKDLPDHQLFTDDLHPLYSITIDKIYREYDPSRFPEIKKLLDDGKVDYIYVNPEFVKIMTGMVLAHPQSFEIVFNNKDMFIKYLKQ